VLLANIKLIISGKNDGQFQILFTATFKVVLKIIPTGVLISP
jgi:hypothetical protein